MRFETALVTAVVVLVACSSAHNPGPVAFFPTKYQMPIGVCRNEPVTLPAGAVGVGPVSFGGRNEGFTTNNEHPCGHEGHFYVAEKPVRTYRGWKGITCFRSEQACQLYLKRSLARSRAERHSSECKRGDKAACHGLGKAYLNGAGVAQDLKRAMKHFRMACEGGVDAACFDLGSMWLKGLGVIKNLETALAHFRKPCGRGHANGCLRLGHVYYEGRLIPRDYKNAMLYYHRACTGGELIGCYNAGVMYNKGQGVPRDFDKAKEYYSKACRGGHTRACAVLTKPPERSSPAGVADQPAKQPAASTPTSEPASRPASESFDPSQWAQP